MDGNPGAKLGEAFSGFAEKREDLYFVGVAGVDVEGVGASSESVGGNRGVLVVSEFGAHGDDEGAVVVDDGGAPAGLFFQGNAAGGGVKTMEVVFFHDAVGDEREEVLSGLIFGDAKSLGQFEGCGGAGAVEGDPEDPAKGLRLGAGGKGGHFLVTGGAVGGAVARAGLKEEAGVDEVVDDGANDGAVVVSEVGEEFCPRNQGLGADEVVDSLPEGAVSLGGALFEALDLELVGAKGEAKHIGGDLPGDALSFDGAGEFQKDLVGDMREGRANAGGGGEFCDQDRGLLNDGVDDKACAHLGSPKKEEGLIESGAHSFGLGRGKQVKRISPLEVLRKLLWKGG